MKVYMPKFTIITAFTFQQLAIKLKIEFGIKLYTPLLKLISNMFHSLNLKILPKPIIYDKKNTGKLCSFNSVLTQPFPNIFKNYSSAYCLVIRKITNYIFVNFSKP